MKKIYYYDLKYPEYGIQCFNVNDELKLIGKNVENLSYLVANYDINMECVSKEQVWIDVYTPYIERDLLVHDRGGAMRKILCYDEKKIKREWNKAIKKRKKDLERSLIRVEEAIKNERCK